MRAPIHGIDNVYVGSGYGTKRVASQYKDKCTVRGFVDKEPIGPDMAAHLAVEMRLGGGTSLIVNSYEKTMDECEAEINGVLGCLREHVDLHEVVPPLTRVMSVAKALREYENE